MSEKCLKNKLKEIIKSDDSDENNKKKIENLVFFVILLIATIVMINYIWNGRKTSNKTLTNTAGKQLAMTDNSSSTSIKDSENLEQKLESILSQIQGVGEVQVFINYSESSETVAMYNENTKTSTTEETDTSGGTRKVESTDSQKELVYQEENGEKNTYNSKNCTA